VELLSINKYVKSPTILLGADYQKEPDRRALLPGNTPEVLKVV